LSAVIIQLKWKQQCFSSALLKTSAMLFKLI
jgi:hypothetical protein